VKEPDIGRHIFAMEENLGFHESYSSSVHRSWEQRFIVLSDTRKDWPNGFMKDTVNNGNLDNHQNSKQRNVYKQSVVLVPMFYNLNPSIILKVQLTSKTGENA
jgi:hypothetical protein